MTDGESSFPLTVGGFAVSTELTTDCRRRKGRGEDRHAEMTESSG